VIVRRTRAWAVTVAVVALGTLVPTRVAAQVEPGDAGCRLDRREQRCHIGVTDPGDPPAETAPVDNAGPGLSGPTAPSPTYWRARSILENAQGVCRTTDGGAGIPHVYELIDRATGAVLETRPGIVCVPVDQDPLVLPAAPAAPAPPAPPTNEEILEATPIEPAVIRVNPAGRGLTGLASWFWLDDAGVVQTSADLEGWHVEGTARVDRWVWRVGDATYTATRPGSEAEPAVEHTFERLGSVEVSVERSWTGSYTVSGFGISYTVDGLTTQDAAAVDYEVIEVRGVLDEGGPG
jgi:hypothetical protein